MAEEATNETEETENAGPTINLTDIRNAIQIIDHAAEQGAFKGWNTIAQVMNVRQKLHAFVEATSPATEASEAEEEAETSEEAPAPEKPAKKAKKKAADESAG